MSEYMKYTVCPHARELPRCMLEIVELSIADLRFRVLCCPACAADIGDDKADYCPTCAADIGGDKVD